MIFSRKISSVYHTHQLNQLLGFVLLCFLDLPLISPTIWNFGSSSQSSDSQPSRIDARATDPNSCTNPRNEQGTCINIRRCDSMIELLKKSRQDPSAVEFLRKASCGYEGRDPKVCCADSISSNGGWGGGSTTQSPPFSTNSNRRGTTTQSPPRNPDRRTNRPTFSTTPSPNSGNRGNGNSGSNGRYTNLPGQDRCGTSKATQANRIVGGQPADLGAWPWMVALGYRKLTSMSNKPNWLCGGALISTRHVLTAAHCISARSDVQLYVVRLGELDLNPDVKDGASPVDIQIAEKIAHPAFNSSTFVNDIGILRLQTPASFTDYIQPICLPFPPAVRDNSFVNYEPFVAGWGTTASNGPASTALRQVQIPVVDNEECKDNYKNIKTAVIDKRVMCAGLAMGGKDSCQGDSGGPLMLPQGLTFYQIGVVSYGKKCAEPGYPGVYTRVSQFLDWIEQTAK